MSADQTSPPRLNVQSLNRGFAGRRVVENLSVRINAGRVTCLLGPSGCGKSTTLRMIAGVDTPDSGKISIDGLDVFSDAQNLPPERRGIGLMFQDFALFPHLSVAQNVAFGLSGPKDVKFARVNEVLDRVAMMGFADAYPDSLSGGEQQRVALARALAPRPKIMLMDEPFSGLDNRLRDGIRDDTLALLREENTAVLLVTHEPQEAMRMADEIALMRSGRIVQTGAPYNVYTYPVDKAAMLFFSDCNVVRAKVVKSIAQTPFGPILTPGRADGTDVEIAFRPQHMRIDFDRATPSLATPENGAPARAKVLRARFVGNESLIEFNLTQTDEEIKALVPNVFLPKAGTKFLLSVPRDKCLVFSSP